MGLGGVKKKKLMILGGSRYAVPVVEAAHRLGVYVITADFLPDNAAHRLSDEYCNVSVIDKEAVLDATLRLGIDGITSFACDPGVLSAAYVAEKMGLPFPPFSSVEILQDKEKFRTFLYANGFNTPFFKGFSSKEAALDEAKKRTWPLPLMVKPVDAAGSKGCCRVNAWEDLERCIDDAIAESHCGRFIVEEFLSLRGHQSGSDSFFIDDKLAFFGVDSQYFDLNVRNPHAPVAHIWPGDMPDSAQKQLQSELQRMASLLNLGTALCNIEARVSTDGKPYIMEVSPRGGGNRLAEVLELATRQRLIENNVRAALGWPLERISRPSYDGVWAVYVVHCAQAGLFESIKIDPVFAHNHVKQCDIYVGKGERISEFSGANKAIGSLFMRFDSYEEAETAVLHPERWLTVQVEE